MKLRYNCEVNRAETGEEEQLNWKTIGELATILRSLRDGDDLVIHCVEDTSGI
jgi:hypothetical protein